MDLRHLRYFVTVAEELHFSRAAERLHITQPPLSQAIQALESELGVQLLVRTKRSVALTAVGERWLAEVRAVLSAADALPGIAERLSRGESGTLNLAFISPADYSILPLLVSRYKARFPNVRVALREATGDLQIEALLEGRIDAGIIIQQPKETLHAALAYQTLIREPIVLAVPEAWILDGRVAPVQDSLDLCAVADESLILCPRHIAPKYHDAVTGCYAAIDAKPRFGQVAVQMQTILSLVAVGMGIALVPGSLRNLGRTGVRYLALAEEPPVIESGLVWRRDNTSPTLARFVELAEEATSTLPPGCG